MPKNTADIILEQLTAWGITNVYGYIGDDVFYLFDAIARHKEITFFQVRHEETAAFMASAHAKLTGRPGVCLADGGPGAVHLLNGLADASADRVPVLAITGQIARKDIGTHAKQYLDQQSLFRPLVSYTSLLCDPAAAVEILGKAFRTAVASRGVAHVCVPMDVLPATCSVNVNPYPPYLDTCAASPMDVMDRALAMMEKAKRPVILVGKGGRKAGAVLADLSARWGAAVISTLPGMEAVSASMPLYIGGLGHAGSPASTSVLKQADLCVVVGANWWPGKYVRMDIPLIQIAEHPFDIGSTTPVPYAVVGDTKRVLEYMLNNLKANPDPEWVAIIKREITGWMTELDAEASVHGSPVHPAALIRALQNTVAKDTIICLDTGDHTVWFGRGFRPRRQRVLLSGKWRSMGFGLPAALAVKIEQPQSHVVAVVGDGGLAMGMADFLTAVKYNLDITVVVVNNSSLGMEKNKMLAGGLQPEGTNLNNPSFAKYAEICGGCGYTVEHSDQLENTLREALSSGRPGIVDVYVDDIAVPGTAMPQ